jgi:conjugal transfer pilus assembly protein TraK
MGSKLLRCVPLASAVAVTVSLWTALAAAQPASGGATPSAVAAPATAAASAAASSAVPQGNRPGGPAVALHNPGPLPRPAGGVAPIGGGQATPAGQQPPVVQQAPTSVPLPAVPAGSVGRPAPAGATGPTIAANVVERTGGAVYVALRQNNIFPVAQGHINRIVTPFARAGVRTASTEQIITEGNIVYVTPVGDAPVTMFVTEVGDERTAISVTLVPRGIPPVELDLRIPGFTPAHARATPAAAAAERTARVERQEQAERWERSQPYVETVATLARRIAMGEVPPGYEAASGAGLPLPICAPAPGMTVNFRGGQAFVGAHLAAFVGVAQNTTREPMDFVEAWCGNGRGVAAVAVSPIATIPPGGRAEVIVIKRTGPAEGRAASRPSLLGVSAPVGGGR